MKLLFFNKYPLRVLFTSILIIACSNSLLNQKAEKQFNINFGTMPNQLSLQGVNILKKPNIKLQTLNGIVYILEEEQKKVMIFNSYGQLIKTYQNGKFQNSPEFKIFKSDFNKIKNIYPGNNFLIIQDELPQKEQAVEKELNSLLLNRLLIFTNDDIFILGQEGLNSKPFPFISNIETYQNGFVVLTKLAKEFIIFSYEQSFKPLYKIHINNDTLKTKDSDLKNEFIEIDNIIFKLDSKELFLKASFYSKIINSETNSDIGVEISSQKIYIFTLKNNKEITLKDKLDIPNLKNTKHGEVFLNLIEIINDKIILETNINNKMKVISLDKKGNLLQESFLEEPRLNILLTQNISKDGILSGLYMNNENVSLYWWNLKNILKL